MKSTRFRRVGSAIERIAFSTRTGFVGLLALISYCIYEAAVSLSYCEPWEWDWPAISAFALVLIGFRVAARLDALLSHALRRLYARGVIACTEDEFERLNGTLALLRRKWAPVWGLSFGLAMIVAFVICWKWGVPCRPALFDPLKIALLAIEAPLCYAVGYYIGCTVVQGRLARVLKMLDIKYSAQPGHPDGAAGLKPLGDFFFRQAMFAGLPAAYVAFWLTFLPHHLTGNTMPIFLILLPIFVFIGIAALVWPMWAFHHVMMRQKHSLVAQADEIAHRISRTQAELREPTSPAQAKELNSQLTLDLKLYEELEGLPTWPVSNQVRRRFAAQNLIIVAIPALRLLLGGNGPELLQKLQDLLAQLFGA